MKFLQALVIITASVILFSCKKGTLLNPDTSLEITIKDNATSAIVPGATIRLFSNEDDLMNERNAVDVKTTSSTGVVKFTGLKSIRYYFSAESGCKSNAFLSYSTPVALASDKNNTVTAKVQGIGLLTFKNTSSNPYRVYINGAPVYDQSGNTTETIYFPAGAVTIRVLQLSGYAVYPTDKTFTGTLSWGGTLTTTYP